MLTTPPSGPDQQANAEVPPPPSSSGAASGLTVEQEIRVRAIALADPVIARGGSPWLVITNYTAYITDGTVPNGVATR